MTDKYTPGPWIVVYRPTGAGNSQWRVYDKDYNPITSSGVGPHAFNEANARLIAAAPEMLAALEDITPPNWSLNDPMSLKYGAARAAIKAAKKKE